YQFPAGSDASEVLQLATAGMRRALEEAWTQRTSDHPLTDKYQLLILASIVEKESGVDDERGQISGVFARRLDLGMRLQTDPTVIYGIGQAYDGDIRRRDLNTTTAWNTYRIDGLPPTPIALPGGASLRAAAAPEPGKSLFFVATGAGDGRHVFSETREAHEKAVQAYLQRQRQP
ncbi:MAG: endolytic transglycosylase MltG, partial [Pseudomonadota bacterium]